MKKDSKLYIFKDREDFVKRLSKDDVINVIGLKGSGKTTNTISYINDDKYIVVNCDKLFDMPTNDSIQDKYLIDIKKLLVKKYGKIEDGKDFIDCYNDILMFAKMKNKKLLIEGNVLCDIQPISQLKGTVIIKRTGVFKCFFRTVKRDYPIKFFLNEEIKKHGKVLGRIYRFKNIFKRRKKIFKEYHDIENIIDLLIKI